MTDDNAGSNWPNTDERSVVEEMIRDQHSKQWEECRTLVKQRTYVKARNIPVNRQEEIVQEVMIKMVRYLPSFRFRCAFKTWLSNIIESCIIDVHRNLRNEGQFVARHGDSSNENDYDGDFSEAWSAEDTFILREELHNATAALLEYTNMHSHSARDQLIVRMVIFEGHNHTETAKTAGCSAPVVGHVVREAQRYVREKMGHKL